MTARREPDASPERPVTRAEAPDSTPRTAPVPAGRVTPGAQDTARSARNALLWVAVVGLVLVWALRDLVLLVGYSVLLAYALLPVVAAIERPFGRRGPRLPRGAAAAVVMLGLVAVVGWLLALAVPRLAAQAAHFAAGAPDALARLVQGARAYGAAHGLSVWLDPAIEDVRANVSGLLENLGGTLAGWAGRGLSGLGQAARPGPPAVAGVLPAGGIQGGAGERPAFRARGRARRDRAPRWRRRPRAAQLRARTGDRVPGDGDRRGGRPRAAGLSRGAAARAAGRVRGAGSRTWASWWRPSPSRSPD